MENIWFPLNEVSLIDPILLKFIWYLTINRIQVELEKEDYASIWPGVTAPGRHENLQISGFRSTT